MLDLPFSEIILDRGCENSRESVQSLTFILHPLQGLSPREECMYLGCETQRVGQHGPCDIDTLRDGS